MKRAAPLALLCAAIGCGGGGSHADPLAGVVGGFRDAALLGESRLAVGGFTGLDAEKFGFVAVLDDHGQLVTRIDADFPTCLTPCKHGEVRAVSVGPDDTIFAAARLEESEHQFSGYVSSYQAAGTGGYWHLNPYSAGNSDLMAVAVDGDSVVTAGWAEIAPGERAVLVSRLDGRTGTPAWVALIARSADPLGLTTAYSIDASADGRIAVAGTVAAGGYAADWFVAELDADGSVLWTDAADGSGSVGKAGIGDFDVAREGRFDVSGDLYVVGESSEAGEGSNIQVVRYDPSGARAWTRQLGSDPALVATSLDRGTALAVAADRLWVGGTLERAIDGSYVSEAAIVSFAKNGTEIWRRDLAGDSTSGEELSDLAIGADGTSVVAGSASSLGLGKDFLVDASDGEGTGRWTAAIERPGQDALDPDRAERVLVDADGNSYAVGTLALPDGRPGFSAVSLDPGGNLRWSYPASAVANPLAH